MDGVAAEHPGSLQLEQGQGPEPGKREGGSSETAAVGAVEVQAGGLQAEYRILQRNKVGRKDFLNFFPPKEERAAFQITALICFYPYQSTAYHTAAAGVERLAVEVGIHPEPGTAGTPDLQIQK